MFADIVVDIVAGGLDRVFQYRIPETLEDKVSAGVRVVIPFGRGNRKTFGYVIGLTQTPSYPEDKIKDIETVMTDGITAEQQLITLAANIKTVYGSTMAAALKTVIPVKRQVRPEMKKTYRLNVEKPEAKALLEKLSKDRRRASAAALVRALMCQESLSETAVIQNLGVSRQVLKGLAGKGVIAEETCRVYRKPVRTGSVLENEKVLNAAQRRAVEGIMAAPGEVHLLHGITGSGKTEVYMALAAEMLAQGKQTIVLIPEIALTLQTVTRFYQVFGDRVSVMNSKLSAGERYDQYMRAREGDVDIIVGPRSALFMPFEHLGMIIIDEEHDSAYKSETSPKYHAREAAVWRAKLCGATVVLGSATPSVTTYYKAVNGIYHLHKLETRAVPGSVPARVTVVDLKNEFKMKNKKIFSGQLTQMITERLARKEQVMLFLNRRGFAGFVSCRNCGYVARCRHCDVSLTAHYDGRLKCHYCGYEQKAPAICPVCGSKYIAAFGTGTQKVETMVAESFPDAEILRLDRDAAAKKDGMEAILSKFRSGGADILVGTQMIVKGHDFPNVTLVGILAADLSMFSGDYLAGETTFDLLAQAAGRAGRGTLPGDVVIQTYQPENYSITCAAAQDYEGFYAQEIAYRKMMHYPPFYHILAVLGECREKERLHGAMALLKEIADKYSPEAEVTGPADAFVSKAKDAYREVIYIKCRQMRRLIALKNEAEQAAVRETALSKVYIQFDMDPMRVY